MFTAVGLGGVFLAPDLRSAFIAPFALSLVVPLACACAIWPLREILGAVRRSFSAPGALPEAGESVRVLEALSAFSGRTALAGLATSLAAAAPRLFLGEAERSWELLGAYLALYSLLNAVASTSLAKSAARLPSAPSLDPGRGEAARSVRPSEGFGLTPREAEVALSIAGGSSYKETAYRLGISIKTVKTHMSKVYEKTRCRSNVELALLLKSDGPGRPSHTKVL